MPVAEPDRTALRAAYRQDEEACIAERLRQAAPARAVHPQAAALAAQLVEGARCGPPGSAVARVLRQAQHERIVVMD